MITTSPWVKLKSEEVIHFKSLIKGWIETTPPKEYNQFMALGYEDGYLEKLSVSWNEKEVTINISDPTCRDGWAVVAHELRASHFIASETHNSLPQFFIWRKNIEKILTAQSFSPRLAQTSQHTPCRSHT